MGGKKCQSNREGFEERRMTSKKREVRKRRCKIQYAEKMISLAEKEDDEEI